jgi:hypothetical protein
MDQHDDTDDDLPQDLKETLAELEEEGFAEFLALPDGPTWGGIALFFGLIVLFFALGWANAAIQTGHLRGPFGGPIFTATGAGFMFGVAVTGWRFNMGWFRVSYEGRSFFWVAGILLAAVSLTWFGSR